MYTAAMRVTALTFQNYKFYKLFYYFLIFFYLVVCTLSKLGLLREFNRLHMQARTLVFLILIRHLYSI